MQLEPFDPTTAPVEGHALDNGDTAVLTDTCRVVVVGHGMVGHRLVESIAENDADRRVQVVVVGEEPHGAYDRVALSSYLDGVSASELGLVAPGWYDAASYALHLEEAVHEIDRAAQVVVTSRGRHLPYDALVLATGSYAFVPPVTGSELPGCFVYRTLGDLDAIRSAAEQAAADAPAGAVPTGLVVGGGLLGLEAARALRLLGLAPHVVELAPQLMPVQVDVGGGALLAQLVSELGVELHLGTSISVIESHGKRLRVTLADKSVLDVDTVVFAAGVRPRDELARECGLEVGARGGVLVDESCHTSDPNIFAIGECANIGGQVYGLVAPGYAMATLVAQQLCGGSPSAFDVADTSTKLKLLGVDVASFGDALARTPGALEVVVNNPVQRTYAKLVVSDDAGTLLGGVLVGDAGKYAALRPLLGRSLPGDPVAMIAPAGSDGGALGGVASIPDDAQICSCYAVTKARISEVIADGEASSVADVKACTKAGTGCGSCVPTLKALLVEGGVSVSRALCEHFTQTRSELFELARTQHIGSFTELVQRHGTGRGCDICKPVAASILASLEHGHVLTGEQATLQDTNDHFLANIQRNGTYSVIPRIAGGEVTPDKLIAIGEVARDFGLYTKITGGQRIDMFGARVEQLPAIWRRLVDAGFESGHAYGKALRTVKSCVGSTWCRYGVQDSVGLAVELELRYRGIRAPHKIKSGVSGCARECAEAQSKDIGIIATENGWNLYVGGNGGFRPRHADLFLTDVDKETLIRTIDRFIMFYIRTADRLQRTATWIESLSAGGRNGLDYLRGVLMDDELSICAELDAAMACHVAEYADEWSQVLQDPNQLARFVSFINAPGTPDPSIEFVTERGQPVPVALSAPPVGTARRRAGVLETAR